MRDLSRAVLKLRCGENF